MWQSEAQCLHLDCFGELARRGAQLIPIGIPTVHTICTWMGVHGVSFIICFSGTDRQTQYISDVLSLFCYTPEIKKIEFQHGRLEFAIH
jgi:hypothetical protein